MSSFTPTTAELALVSQVFAAADTQKLGIITGDAAVNVFAGAKLTPTVLGEVWAIADKDNNGFLTRKGVAIALRLIGHAQNGQPVRESFLDKPAPLAHIEGISKTPSTTPSFSSSPVPRSPPPAGTSAFPPLTPQDKTKFARIFAGSGPVNGVLGGDKAKDIFIKSKLPVDKLSQIWNMADTQNRGALDQTDFTIAMYLIQACMSNKIPVLPVSLPPGLYDQAAGGQSQGLVSHGTGTSGSFSPVASIFPTSTGTPVQSQYTGQSVLRPRMTGQAYQGSPSHPSAAPVSKPSPFSVAPQPWDISPEEKANADRFFEGIDTERKGYIEGDVAVPFMLQSKLPEDTLAQIWDLADLNNDGRLTRDGFAVAMHLIQGKLSGKEVPATLPESLIPPSLRAQKSGWGIPFSAPTAPPPMSEPMRDLLGDDTPLPTTGTPSTIGASPFPPQATGTTRTAPVVPQSHGGFAPQTSLPTPAPSGFSPFPPQVHKDLLGDDDEPTVASPPLPDNSAEIGNVQNQLNSTNRSLETTKSERHQVEQNLANQAGELSALQTQLFSAKAAYETETKLLSNLRERFSTQAAEIQKTKEELIRAESDLSAVRVEKSETEGGFLRDKEEVRDLHRKMKEVGDEVEQLKAAIEKAKRDAKQQKGLLAIARKQLSTREAEKAKVARKLADASADAEQAAKEREEAEAELAKEPEANHLNGSAQPPPLTRLDTPAFAATQALPVSPNITGPLSATSTGTKSTNPFERLAMSSGSPSSRSASPFQSFAAESPAHPSSVAPSTEINEADDPFGLSDAVEDAQPTLVADKSPKPAPISIGQLATPVSPDEDDLFRTPLGTSVAPSTAVTPHEVKATTNVDDIGGTLTSLEDAATNFPPLDGQFPGSFPTEGHKEASDLSGPLKEIEHDSDTDSDDEAAFQDARVSVKDNEPSSPVAAHTDHEVAGPNGNAVAPSSTTFAAFDDAFGVSAPNPAAAIAGPGSRSQSPANLPAHRSPTPNKAAEEDLFSASNGVKPATPFDAPSANLPDAGLSAFDEAMGKVPSSASGDTPNFKFDSAFDDNFDFAAAGAGTAAFPPPPSKQTTGSVPPASSPLFAVNGTKTASTPKADDGGFDSIFGAQDKAIPQSSVPTSSFLATSAAESKPLSFDDAFASTTPSGPSEAKTTDPGISFDDAFGGGDGLSKTLTFDPAFKPATTPAVAAASPSATAPSSPAVTFENASGPASPTSPTVGKRSTSPSPRHHSPPPRTSSPRPRPSTGSSKDSSHEKPVSTARHSKLSIRLPFGKKDKKKAKNEPIIPQASTYLSPVSEPSRVMTPAVEDDVEPVKQLCGMGFSRTQAVNALETHGYDVQKALNSLLGQG